jgi:hypothetical protein
MTWEILLSVIREKRPSARIFPKEKDGPYKHIFQQRNGMTFSYRLRPGVAQNMNACFLMKKMGIAVTD